MAAVVALLAGTALLLPAVAGAHASLVDSSPGHEERLEQSPRAIELEFSDRVVAGRGSVRVFGPDGERVGHGKPQVAGRRVTQPARADAAGTYGVAWRVSSEDGHVITGSLEFTVGSATSGTGAARASREAAQVDRSLHAAASAARFIELLALLVAAGGGLFVALVAPQWRPRLLLPALAALLAAYAAGYVLHVAMVRGTGIGAALQLDALRSTADTPFALALQVRALIAVVALAPAALLQHGRPLGGAARAAVALVFAALAASVSITGHAATTEPATLRMPLDMLHVIAAAVWVGGLVQLGLLAPFAAAHADAVARFSRVAFASVVVLLATGAFAAWAELGMRPDQLLESRYGRLVLAKLVLYLGTMPLAWNNMGAFVPQVRRRPDDAPRMLRQYVWRELALLVAVVALTAWLIATPQPA